MKNNQSLCNLCENIKWINMCNWNAKERDRRGTEKIFEEIMDPKGQKLMKIINHRFIIPQNLSGKKYEENYIYTCYS